MVSDIYLRRIANLLVRQHGDNAVAVVAELPDEYFGPDAHGAQIKDEIVAAIRTCILSPNGDVKGVGPT